ncbi:MAG: hypothetical protein IKI20_01760 [Lachnospiraceae bacterium]|nr:hypothetical protein [Lachnospiraceae bacterium]
MDENLTPAADMSVVDAPTIENVMVDAPVIENKIQDIQPVIATPEPVVVTPEPVIATPEPVISVPESAVAPEAVTDIPAAEPVSPAPANNIISGDNIYFDNRVTAQNVSGGFGAQNEYSVQHNNFTPQGNIGVDNIYNGQNYSAGAGNFRAQNNFGVQNNYGGQGNYGSYGNSYGNSGMDFRNNNGYDYGYSRGEYSTDYVPDGAYSNDPFSSFYYDDEEEYKPESNGKAVGAMICGIVSLASFYSCVGWIPGIVAICLGAAGLKKVTNRGKAVAGFIMGILGTIIGGFYMLYMIIERF